MRWLVALLMGGAVAAGARAAERPDHSELLTKEHIVDAARRKTEWQPAFIGQPLYERDRLRTGNLSRASLRLTNLAVLRVNELTTLEILPPEQMSTKPTLDLKGGSIFFHSREKPQELHLRTPIATGALRGTEFHASVGADGRTVVTMLEGELELRNALGSVLVGAGEQGVAEAGRAPYKTAVIEAVNIIQWCLYYPGVVDLHELAFTAGERVAIAPSIAAYAEGDLLRALELYPRDRRPGSSAEKIYRAALVLSVGQVGQAEAALRSVPREAPGREALRLLIAAVKFREERGRTNPTTSSQWVAESYYHQSRSELEPALAAARAAVARSPQFGFGWARVAELEFSFGRIRPALKALDRALALSPRHAQAHALRGFLLSAQNQHRRAREAFERAIAIDPALGNAWLGRGLGSIRKGDDAAGRLDLQAAAALEANRSLLRSYLGKAFSNAGLDGKARLELRRAKELDARDPTPWLYSALQARQENRVNDGVRELERSLELNENRRVYRSRFLLDQDRAVRGANLASIYRAAGMNDYSVREATRAVESDYGSASTHLFLASSYDALRDPRRIALRYETPWFNELLLANLLSPVGGGPLSQYVSQQEYSKLFESDRLGLSSTTVYLGTGQLRETASQFGIAGNVSYALDADYFHDSGTRPNSAISRFEGYAQLKLQLGPQDTLFFQTKYEDLHNGDVFQYYHPLEASRTYDFRETQDPALLLAGYHHEWNPGVHTLLLVGRLENRQRLTQSEWFSTLLRRDLTGRVVEANTEAFDLDYRAQFETYSAELSQIWQGERHTLVAGVRFQQGSFRTAARLDGVAPDTASFFGTPPSDQDFRAEFERSSVYAYRFWRLFEPLTVIAGLTLDRITYPANFRSPPLLAGEESVEKVLPKLGAIWRPSREITVRAAYTESVAGASFDESIRLEPTQVAGFSQTYRTIISESIASSVAVPIYKTLGGGIDGKLPTGTYWGVEAAVLRSEVQRLSGVFGLSETLLAVGPQRFEPSFTVERLDYEEKVLTASANQLMGRDWSVGAAYRLSEAELHTRLPEVAVAAYPAADRLQESTLQQLNLFALFNHPCGVFARADALWTSQENRGHADAPAPATAASPTMPGDDFWQYNAEIGFRFARNRAEVAVGVLNLSDTDYQMHPLNFYRELPRERTVLVRLRLDF